MKITIGTSSQKFTELLAAQDVINLDPPWTLLSLINKTRSDYEEWIISIGFDLTWVTADIRVENWKDASMTESGRLSEFTAFTFKEPGDLYFIADSSADVLFFVA